MGKKMMIKMRKMILKLPMDKHSVLYVQLTIIELGAFTMFMGLIFYHLLPNIYCVCTNNTSKLEVIQRSNT